MVVAGAREGETVGAMVGGRESSSFVLDGSGEEDDNGLLLTAGAVLSLLSPVPFPLDSLPFLAGVPWNQGSQGQGNQRCIEKVYHVVIKAGYVSEGWLSVVILCYCVMRKCHNNYA